MRVVTLKTEARTPEGSSGARRVRRAGRMPAVIYGGGGDSEHVSLPTHEFRLALENGARVLDLERGAADATRVLLTDVQFDALGRNLLHADLLRVDPNKELELNVPVVLSGVPKGVTEGGVLTTQHMSVRVSCLPREIPEQLDAEISGLELGETLYARDIALPERVELACEPDMLIITIAVPRGVESDEEEAAEGEGEGAGEGADAAEAGPEASAEDADG